MADLEDETLTLHMNVARLGSFIYIEKSYLVDLEKDWNARDYTAGNTLRQHILNKFYIFVLFS